MMIFSAQQTQVYDVTYFYVIPVQKRNRARYYSSSFCRRWTVWRPMVGCLMNQKVLEGSGLDLIEIPARNLPGGAEENHEICQST